MDFLLKICSVFQSAYSNKKVIAEHLESIKSSKYEAPKASFSNDNYIIKELTIQQKVFTDNERSEIALAYARGESTYALAKKYSCHRSAISRVLKQQGIEVTNQKAKKKVLAEMVMQLYSEMYKPAEIGKALGVSADTVRRILKDNNIVLRQSWEYPKE